MVIGWPSTLRPSLRDIGFERLERAGDRLEGVVPGAGALHVDDRLCGERRVLAERIARLSGAAGRCSRARRRVGLGCARRRRWLRLLRPGRLWRGKRHGRGRHADAKRRAKEHQNSPLYGPALPGRRRFVISFVPLIYFSTAAMRPPRSLALARRPKSSYKSGTFGLYHERAGRQEFRQDERSRQRDRDRRSAGDA